VNRKKSWSQLEPYFRADRGTWEIAVPASLAGGKRFRPSFPDRPAAERWIAEKALDAASGRAVALSARSGGGISLEEILRLYRNSKAGKLVPEAYRIQGNRLGKLAERFRGRAAGDLTAWEIKRWLADLPCSQRSKHGVFSEGRGLYRWAVRYGMLKENPFDQMEPEKRGIASKAILTPEQMRELLAFPAPDFFRAWLVLGGFAGLRSAEIFRLDWSAVNRGERQIFIGSEVIKRTSGVRNHYVQILPTLKRWLPSHRSGPVVPVVTNGFSHWRNKACDFMGWARWPQNALRHSFASYHLSHFADAAKLACEMGHTSTQMIFANYAEAVTKRAARQWWGL
jgi:integrase